MLYKTCKNHCINVNKKGTVQGYWQCKKQKTLSVLIMLKPTITGHHIASMVPGNGEAAVKLEVMLLGL